MDEELRALERASLRLGPRYAALVHRDLEPLDSSWERLTLVGLFGHKGCLLWQGREHCWLVPVCTVAALVDLGPTARVYDLQAQVLVRVPVYYLYDFEVGWTDLVDETREHEREESERNGQGNSGPYRVLGPLRGRPAGWRGPMHEEIEQCEAKFRAARAEVECQQAEARARGAAR